MVPSACSTYSCCTIKKHKLLPFHILLRQRWIHLAILASHNKLSDMVRRLDPYHGLCITVGAAPAVATPVFKPGFSRFKQSQTIEALILGRFQHLSFRFGLLRLHDLTQL